jgi:hypothetical protein
VKSVSDLVTSRQAGADPLRPERAAGRANDHRRRTDSRLAADARTSSGAGAKIIVLATWAGPRVR